MTDEAVYLVALTMAGTVPGSDTRLARGFKGILDAVYGITQLDGDPDHALRPIGVERPFSWRKYLQDCEKQGRWTGVAEHDQWHLKLRLTQGAVLRVQRVTPTAIPETV